MTHGRHCPCSACAREDWTQIEAPCGMHGASCPREYQPVSSAATVEPHVMDRMGAWDECGGVAWFAREHYPTPADMRRFYLAEFDPGISYIELRVLARYARHAPDDSAAPEFDGEFWVQCGKDELGAFPVWRVE